MEPPVETSGILVPLVDAKIGAGRGGAVSGVPVIQGTGVTLKDKDLGPTGRVRKAPSSPPG